MRAWTKKRLYLLVNAQLGYQHLCTEVHTTPDHSLISQQTLYLPEGVIRHYCPVVLRLEPRTLCMAGKCSPLS